MGGVFRGFWCYLYVLGYRIPIVLVYPLGVPRPRLGSAAHIHTVSIKMSTSELETLDEARGGRARSDYIRRVLFAGGADAKTKTDRTPAGGRTPRSDPERPNRPPNHLVAVKPGERHYHRYHKVNEVPIHHDQGRPVYAYACECGAEKNE